MIVKEFRKDLLNLMKKYDRLFLEDGNKEFVFNIINYILICLSSIIINNKEVN